MFIPASSDMKAEVTLLVAKDALVVGHQTTEAPIKVTSWEYPHGKEGQVC